MRPLNRVPLTLLTATLVAASALAEQPETVALTIYSTSEPGGISPGIYQPAYGANNAYAANQIPGFAIVRQERTVTLKPGEDTLRFQDVAALIDPTTVLFASLTDPTGTHVLEQNFVYDLVNTQALLEKFIDRPITVVSDDDAGFGGKSIKAGGSTLSGTLLSAANGQLVLQTSDLDAPIQILMKTPQRVGLSELPGGLITRPTLIWKLRSDGGGEQRTRVSYETQGITWWADYNAVFAEGADENHGTLDLSAWVSIINQSGATYHDAKLKLIAGDVQRIQPQQQQQIYRHARGGMAMAENLGFQEKAFFDYHLYTLSYPTTVSDNSTKQLELFPAARGIPCERLYVYRGSPDFAYYGTRPITDREFGSDENKKVGVYLRFTNDEKSRLGMPLPAGRVRVNKLDPDDELLEFVGEDALSHTPRNEKVLLKVGSAFDIVGERTRTSFTVDTNRRMMEESFEIKVRNRKDKPVDVLVREVLFRWATWRIDKASHDYQKADARTVEFPVTVKPDEEQVISYTVRYTW